MARVPRTATKLHATQLWFCTSYPRRSEDISICRGAWKDQGWWLGDDRHPKTHLFMFIFIHVFLFRKIWKGDFENIGKILARCISTYFNTPDCRLLQCHAWKFQKWIPSLGLKSLRCLIWFWCCFGQGSWYYSDPRRLNLLWMLLAFVRNAPTWRCMLRHISASPKRRVVG